MKTGIYIYLYSILVLNARLFIHREVANSLNRCFDAVVDVTRIENREVISNI